MSSPVFLSILIPVYNWDISALLKILYAQCSELSGPEQVEIIVADDGSSQKYDNRLIAEQLSGIIYKELPENIGRASVRNYLIGLSQGEYVLFLDADMLPDQEDFVKTYVELARSGKQIICGGISYRQFEQGDPSSSFHIYKSLKTEALPADTRSKMPWRYVFTSNIMLRSDILQSVRFDPRFTSYGFEDIEWAIRLAESYQVNHIDNTCSHMGVLDKGQVFKRMREAINNHYLLYTLYPEKIGSVGAVKMARFFQYFPDVILLYGDKVISFLFDRISLNQLLYPFFQCDKVILLARKIKENRLALS